ncbi:uncharacterized protein LOC6544203 [Drosophila erecta]|uniref:MD-2-related lipid-recognition domain-containing protein n=1 Tax=Drosophila erecta TaxID=7220 RepID=B3NED6_DROER|nr:uncharacterized protein LOC6544203 [Drosophila erecta]EDV52771.2 uncharacterized protein Dere_GG16265 [Drosophila erecta]
MWKIACVLIGISVSQAESSSVTVTRIHCEKNPKFFTTLNVTSVNSTFYADVYMPQDLKAGFRGHVDVQLRLSNAKKFQSLVQADNDYCELLSTFKDSLFRRWIKSVFKNSNLMENCPVPAGHYFVNGWHVDMGLVPSYLLSGDYLVNALFYYGKYRTKKQTFLLRCTVGATMHNK